MAVAVENLFFMSKKAGYNLIAGHAGGIE